MHIISKYKIVNMLWHICENMHKNIIITQLKQNYVDVCMLLYFMVYSIKKSLSLNSEKAKDPNFWV